MDFSLFFLIIAQKLPFANHPAVVSHLLMVIVFKKRQKDLHNFSL